MVRFEGLVVGLIGALLLLPAGCSSGDEAGDPDEDGDGEENCPTGSEGCSCYGNLTCDGDLQCRSALCVNLGAGGSSTGGGGGSDGATGGSGAAEGGSSASPSGGASGSPSGGSPSGGSPSGGSANGGSSNGGASGSGMSGSTGTGGTGGSTVDLAELPEACALVTSCAGCCTTVGVFALDPAANDMTELYVTQWSYDGTEAAANYTFRTSDEVGAIYFKLAAPTSVASLGVTAGLTNGSLEMALVRSAGAHGCIYPIIGDLLYPYPSACWGDGAGPYLGTAVDQIEVRVRSAASGPVRLVVSDLLYEP